MTKQFKVLVVGSILIIGLGGVLFFAQPDDRPDTVNTNGGENILQVSEQLHDFGTISMKDGLVTNVFKIKNPQVEAMRLTKLYTSCMCTKAKLTVNGKTEGPFGMPGHGSVPTFNQIIESNAEAEIEVVFDPNAHGPSGVGLIQREIVLEGSGGKLVTVEIKANVTP